jgi:hypothetical protein
MDLIQLSLRGHVGRYKRDMLLRYDWIVARMLASAAEGTDQLYLDADPLNFRIILSLLQGIMVMDLDLEGLSSAELTLLKDCAKYLSCESIASQLLKCIEDMKIAIERVDAECTNKLKELKAEISSTKKDYLISYNEIKRTRDEELSELRGV